MRRRDGFTLVEMMVSVALILFIMVILTEAFGKGLESFRTLKALGDMESRMRSTVALVRRDLGMDHFEGRRKLSDPTTTWKLAGPPREGFFYLEHRPLASIVDGADEGTDADNIASRRRTNHRLHFTVRAKGNDRGEFFTAKVPGAGSSPVSLIGTSPVRSTFFDHPADSRFQDTSETYSSQWAEVAYFLAQPASPVTTPDGTRLFTLYRAQYVMVTDNSKINWNPRSFQGNSYAEMCCVRRDDQGSLNFSTPSDVARDPAACAFNNQWSADGLRAAKPLLSDVVSFDFEVLRGGTWGDLIDDSTQAQRGGRIDSRNRHVSAPGLDIRPVEAIKICLRVYDPKTKLSRQMTIIQDL